MIFVNIGVLVQFSIPFSICVFKNASVIPFVYPVCSSPPALQTTIFVTLKQCIKLHF